MVLFICFFFFQAEDGIRDLVRSRGLGDLYKRQHLYFAILFLCIFLISEKKFEIKRLLPNKQDYLWIAFISVLTLGYRFSQVVAISMSSVALTLAVKRTSVLWATVIGGKIFKDTNLIKKIIAVIFILLGAILILSLIHISEPTRPY